MSDAFSNLLTYLAYEFFGVFLPGIVATLFLLLIWAALGQAAPYWSLSLIPEFSPTALRALLESLSPITGISVVIPLFAIWYFLGHLLLWIGRTDQPTKDTNKVWWKRMGLSLLFSIPTPKNSFHPTLQPLYDDIRVQFNSTSHELEWRQFYPVAKSYISEHLTHSLVHLYQNKYTFHRSIVCASAALFWLNIAVVLISVLAYCFSWEGQPNWIILASLISGSLILVWGFSGSFSYHWEMFGNSLITELYAYLRGPHIDKACNRKGADTS